MHGNATSHIHTKPQIHTYIDIAWTMRAPSAAAVLLCAALAAASVCTASLLPPTPHAGLTINGGGRSWVRCVLVSYIHIYVHPIDRPFDRSRPRRPPHCLSTHESNPPPNDSTIPVCIMYIQPPPQPQPGPIHGDGLRPLLPPRHRGRADGCVCASVARAWCMCVSMMPCIRSTARLPTSCI